MQLRSTPHGEFYDVLQSDATAELLALYPTALLAGEIEFASQRQRQPDGSSEAQVDLIGALAKAAILPGTQLKRVLLRPYHVLDMGSAALAQLHTAFGCRTNGTSSACPAVEILKDWVNPKLKRPGAISDARLAALAADLNLVSVIAQPYLIQWITNTLDNGDVLVYLGNNKGVIKPACAAVSYDNSRTTNVTVTPTKFRYSAIEEWLGDVTLQATNGTSSQEPVTLTLRPGAAALLHFSVSK